MTLVSSVGTVLGIVDRVADQLERFRKSRDRVTPEPDVGPIQHSIMAEQTGSTIRFLEKGGREVETVTAHELSQLDSQSQQLIAALEESMTKNFDLWTKVYPKLNSSPDPVVNAQVESQLNAIGKRMCQDLTRILDYLQTLGKHLFDHYSHIRYVCERIERTAPIPAV